MFLSGKRKREKMASQCEIQLYVKHIVLSCNFTTKTLSVEVWKEQQGEKKQYLSSMKLLSNLPGRKSNKFYSTFAINIDDRASFSIFLKLYFVYDVQWP